MKQISNILLLFLLTAVAPAPAAGTVKHFFIVVLENTNIRDAQNAPFLGSVMKKGAYLNDYHALAHPSQPNYIGLVAGDMMGVVDDNNRDIKGQHLGDLLEAKSLRWKAYIENWPGNCFMGETKTRYARKHNPFISFVNVQKNKKRCNDHLVGASQLDADIASGNLPEYAFYVPNLDDDGHDTGIKYADNWMSKAFGPRFKDPKFMTDTVVAITFDENDVLNDHDHNTIYTALIGAGVKAGVQSNKHYNSYNLLATVEKIFGLGNLGRGDAQATPIDDIWN